MKSRLVINNHAFPLPHARGAALFISMMFLIILTLIGLSAANVGIMQERMAGNVRETNEAFQVAEQALREIENEVDEIVGGSGGSIGGIPLFSELQTSLGLTRSNCTLSEADPEQWPWTVGGTISKEYIVYQITDTLDPATGMVMGSPCAPMFETGDTPMKPFNNVYLVGARAEGPAGTAEVVVQSIVSW